MSQKLKILAHDESGATAIEYGLIAALIFLGAMTAITTTGQQISNLWETNSEAVDEAVNEEE